MSLIRKLKAKRSELTFHGSRVMRFAFVSGTGLTLDFSLFLSLHGAGISAFLANCVSSAAGLCFVFFASVKHIFRVEDTFMFPMFWAYIAYQITGTVICSEVISALHHSGLGLSAAAVKIAILPITFLANYGFMAWLTSNHRSWNISRQTSAQRA